MSATRQNFFNHLAQTSPYPFDIEVSKAEGVYIYDTNGKKYMDLISGIAVSNLGHNHPEIIKAIKEQIDKHLHVMVYGEYMQNVQSAFAKKLCELTPNNLNCVYPVNSGTEANEAALKLVKRVTGRTEIISFGGAYHGSTHGSLSISGNETKKFAFRPLLPDIRFIRFNQKEDLHVISEKTAGVFIEPIQGDAGVRIPNLCYMQALNKRCKEVGALLVVDEIQTGIGRTGKMFAFEHFGIEPDVITLGKAIGGGLPMGVLVARKSHLDLFTHNPMLGHITTFGGHPVICAAALSNLFVLTKTNIIRKVEQKGALLEKYLNGKKVKEVRRKGLMFAVEMDSFETVNNVVEACKKEGIISYWFLSTPNAFRLAPPLTITEEEIKIAGNIIQKNLN